MNNICYGCMQEKVNNEEICPLCDYENINRYDTYYLPQGHVLLDQYVVGKVLGHGGFGITYISKDTKTGEIVAIKEYFPGEYATRSIGDCDVIKFTGENGKRFDEGLSRFFKEGKILEKYNNVVGIVTAKDVFKANNTAYIVMEYIDGISLEDYLLESGGAIPFDSAISIIVPVMDSLKEVHKSGLIHRDISPDNIYITSTGQVKLIDFGAAKQISSQKSKSMSVILKQGYAPEEQYRSKGKLGPWTDVYAVAATIYRMITGVIPIEPMERSYGEDITKPTAQGIRIPDRIEKTLFKALEIKSENRYQTIGEFQNNLLGNKSLISSIKERIAKRRNQRRLNSRGNGIQFLEIAAMFVLFISVFMIWNDNTSRVDAFEGSGELVEITNDITEKVIVPDLRGFSIIDADYIFNDLEIIVKYIYDYNEEVEKNHVVSQSYTSHEIGKNQLIVVTISKGSKEIVSFDSEELENVIRKAIGKDFEPIYLGDVQDIKALDIHSKNISSLIGIDVLINLETLDASANQISDIEPLKSLTKLKYLNLSNNYIDEIHIENGFHNLLELQVSKNRLKSVSIISSLNQVELLDLSGNGIKNIKIEKSANKLKTLYLNDNQIEVLDFSESVNVVSDLDLSNNLLTDVDHLENLSHLEKLNIQSNRIVRLPDLSSNERLTFLYANTNQIEEINFEAELPRLRIVNLSHNNIKKVYSTKGIANVEEFYMQDNKLSSISNLKSLIKVEELDLSNNLIENTSGITKLKKLRTLLLNNNKITYISGINSFPDLKLLNLSYNNLKSNYGLYSMGVLEELYLNNNDLTELSMMNNLSTLKKLDLSDNRLTYVRNIYNLKALENLNLSENRLVGIYQSLNSSKNLKVLNLSVNNPVRRRYQNSTRFYDVGGPFDLSFLRNLPLLEDLDLSFTNTTNLYYVSELDNLTKVNVSSNPVYNTSNQKYTTALSDRGVTILGFSPSVTNILIEKSNTFYIYGVYDE